MRPRTYFQKRVLALSRELKELSKEQREWAINLLPCFVYTKKHTYTCLDCHHTWYRDDTNDKVKVGKEWCPVCPNCKKTLHHLGGRRRSAEYIDGMKIVTMYKGLQLIRRFRITKTVKDVYVGPFYSFEEVYQHWFSPKGEWTIMGRNMGAFGVGFSSNPAMEIRSNHKRYYNWDDHIYPDVKIMPVIRRNGFRKGLHRIDVAYIFQQLLQNPKAEILWKNKQYHLFGYLEDYKTHIDHNWSQIRIAIRHRYIVKQTRDWFDHINILDELGMDKNNPKYICPDDFNREHQRLTKKVNKIRKEKLRKEQMENYLKDNEKYIEKKKKYFNFEVSENGISIKPLKSLFEFMEEADSHGHCVFTPYYYDSNNKLILSAKINGVPIETIDLNLKSMTISQSRGNFNQPTKHHKKIVALMEKNITQLKKIHNETTQNKN